MDWKRRCLLFALVAASCSKVETEPAVPPVYTIQASFVATDPETRSRLDFEETQARVLWSRGDAFKMVRMNESSYSSATFTTQDDGVENAVFTTNKTLSGSAFTSGYPADVYRVGRLNTMDCCLITPVPSQQQAVAGGVAEGLNRAAAYSTNFSADLRFHNMLSYIRFRVEGACVSTLESVTFYAGTSVAGDASVYFVDGEPVIDFSKNWSNPTVERASSITLTGPFEAGRDYCIALVPATLPSGFSMMFQDGEGHSLSKYSRKALQLSRSRIADFGTIQLGDSWETEEYPAVYEYVKQTKGRKKNVIALLADGFQATELDQFMRLAKDAVNYLFSVEPYKSYKDYFTVYICSVASNQSGAGVTDANGNVITSVDNYFGSRWPDDGTYSNMTADRSTIESYLRSHIPEVVAGELTYQDVPTTLIINDTRYGGICHPYGSGWAYCQVPYQKAGSTIRWSFPKYQAVDGQNDSLGYRETTEEERDEMGRMVGDWKNAFVHEFGGHAYGRLTDEYWSETATNTAPAAIAGHSYSVPYALNISGFYETVPWKADLLDHRDDWTARNPDYGKIGIWHGASKSLYFRWRSEKTSCMIDNRPYFSTWQRILIVRKIMEKAGETFDMDDFLAQDVTVDPFRPVVSATASVEERRQTLLKARSQALLVPEEPMLPSPVIHLEDEF